MKNNIKKLENMSQQGQLTLMFRTSLRVSCHSGMHDIVSIGYFDKRVE